MAQTAATSPRPVSYPPRNRWGTALVFNETTWPIKVTAQGLTTTVHVIAPGEEASIALPPAAIPTLAVSGPRHHQSYALDLGLLGFDTVHVRAADLLPVAAR